MTSSYSITPKTSDLIQISLVDSIFKGGELLLGRLPTLDQN